MKRNLWGYDKKKTDEYIEQLEGQIDILNSKLAVLTIELNTANEELKSKQVLSKLTLEQSEAQNKLVDRVNELEFENKKIIEKYDGLLKKKEQQITLLKKENARLSTRLSELEEKIEQEETLHENAESFILASMSREKVIAEAEKIKNESRKEIMSYVDRYIETLNESNEKLNKIIRQIRADYKSVIDGLSDCIERLSESLEVIDTYNSRIEKGIIPVNDLASEIKTKLEQLWENSFQPLEKTQFKRLDTTLESNYNDKEEELEVAKKKTDIIKINTNVKSTDVFHTKNNLDEK